MAVYRALCVALVAIAVSAGESPKGPYPAATTNLSPGRGELIEDPPAQVGVYPGSELLSDLSSSALGLELLQLTFPVSCTVTTYHLEYGTVGGRGEPASASGVLMVPSGSDPSCQGPRPIVVYAHGTAADKAFNIADITAPGSTEGLLLAALFAAGGYIVAAPNYAGYDTSNLPYHPYLNAEQQSKDMIDCLKAAQTALGALGLSTDGKVFVTGYSQGGFVALATQRAMEAAGMTVTASGPMSGPYALAALGDALFEGEVSSSAPENVALLVSSYQHSYGNVYTAPTNLTEEPYADGIDGLLPSSTPISTLYAQGSLPRNAVFSGTPPAPLDVAITQATQPARLAPVFARGFGTGNLITDSYRASYLRDALAHPDGGFPAVTTDEPAAAPALALRQDLKKNDLRNWVPKAPVLLCGGANDPTVLYLNTRLMQTYWANKAPAAPVTVLDVDSRVADEDPYATEKEGFATAEAALRASSGSDAVVSDYHATLVPPFCLYAVKEFFDSMQGPDMLQDGSRHLTRRHAPSHPIAIPDAGDDDACHPARRGLRTSA